MQSGQWPSRERRSRRDYAELMQLADEGNASVV